MSKQIKEPNPNPNPNPNPHPNPNPNPIPNPDPNPNANPNQVRQSAYALVGDLAKNCIGTLRPGLAQYLPVLCEQLAPEFVSVCNNASWAIGEIAVKVPSPYP